MRLIDIDIRRHFKRLSIFFLHTFVVTIYTSLDQVLLGFMVDTRAVAFMTRSKVVTSTAIAISTTISNVTMPRASYYKDTCEEKFRALMSEVPKYILLITIPMTVGCLCLADSIMYILGGSEFLQAGNLLMVMAPIIILSPLSGYLQYQVLVASGKEKLGLKCAVVTSFVSVGLNAVLITTMGFFGAGIVQTLAEFTAVSLRYYIAKRVLKYKEIRFINKASIAYSVASLIMGAVVLLIRILISDLVVSFMVSAVVGASVYIAVLLIAREKLVTFMLGQIKTRMKISWGE